MTSDDKPRSKLAAIVAEMRELGVKEYHTDEGVKVVLGDSPRTPLTEDEEEAQQRLRDEREKARLALRRRMLTGASMRIGPPLEDIK